MAVVQISRIQLRRGKENSGSGLPQLASGELAWAIDTQKLYIGNGAVGEGAPAVGNTKILTEADNLLDFSTYIYKDEAPLIQTGDNVNFPIVRTLQDRLDDRVSSASYGILPLDEDDNVTDQSVEIQRAIKELKALVRIILCLILLEQVQPLHLLTIHLQLEIITEHGDPASAILLDIINSLNFVI